MYRLGLIQCDVVPDDLKDRFKDYPVMFAAAFERAGVDVDWQVYNIVDEQHPARLDEVDGYITTGSRAGVYDDEPWYDYLRQLIRNIDQANIPLVGICFGHQAIADALGGRVEKSDKGWGIGINQYTMHRPAPWVQPALDDFSIPVCHQDQVVELPAGSELLASNGHCENFIAQFSPTSLGIQGHPEFQADYIETLIKLREDILPETVKTAAEQSLAVEHDNSTVVQWIAEFLQVDQKKYVKKS